MAGQAPSYVASEDLGVSLFVRIKPGTDHQVELCAAGQVADGVTHEGPREAQIPGISTMLAAKTGESTRIYGVGESCEVLAGAAVSAGDKLKPDANAKAIPAVAGDQYSAVARAGVAAADERVQIYLEQGTIPV